MSYVPYSPVVPRGASTYSFVCLLLRFNSIQSAGLSQLKELGLRSGFFSETATVGTVSKVCCNEVIPPNHLLIEHTVFGFYSLSLEKNERDKWIEAIVQKRDLNRNRSWVKSVTACSVDPSGLRFCPDCVDAEKRELGASMWSVVNQLPFIRHCAVHGTALKAFCKNCKQALDKGNRHRLPEDCCGKCGGLEFDDIEQIGSISYKRVVTLCFEAFTSQPDDYRPKYWIDRTSSVTQFHGSVDSAVASVYKSIWVGWGVAKVSELNHLLNFEFTSDFVGDLLAGSTLNQPLLAQIVVREALERNGTWQLAGSSKNVNQVLQDKCYIGKQDQGKLRAISSKLSEYGVPGWAVAKLTNGSSLSGVAGELNVDARKLRKVIKNAVGAHDLNFLQITTNAKPRKNGSRGMENDEKTSYYKQVVEEMIKAEPKLTRGALKFKKSFCDSLVIQKRPQVA